jgi:tetratricopeptide (TPR) repeat protein
MPQRDFDDLWDYDNPAETEKKFRDHLAKSAAQDLDYRLELTTQIARTLGLQRKFDEAHKTLDDVEKQLTSVSAAARVRYLLERGRVFNSSKQASKAVPLFKHAYDLGVKEKEEFFAIDAAHMLGIASPPNEQLDWNLKALAMAEKATDPKARNWQGSLLNNIGWTYHDAKQYEKALEIFQKALVFREAQGKAVPIQIAKWSVARALRSLAKLDEALTIQEALLKEHEAAKTKDAFVHEELAEIYAMKHREAESKIHFAAAYAELSKDPWFVENEPARLKRMKELGGVR